MKEIQLFGLLFFSQSLILIRCDVLMKFEPNYNFLKFGLSPDHKKVGFLQKLCNFLWGAKKQCLFVIYLDCKKIGARTIQPHDG